MTARLLLFLLTAAQLFQYVSPAEADSGVRSIDDETIGEYLSLRDELMLKKNPENLDHDDVLGAVYAAQEYLFHALGRDNKLDELYRIEKHQNSVLDSFKQFFSQQARKYKESYEEVRIDFKVASDAELREGRQAYRCMLALIRRSDSRIKEALNYDFDELADKWKSGK